MTTPSGSGNENERNANSVPFFPNYPAPVNPQGIPFHGEKFHGPLYKMARAMMKMKSKAPSKSPSRGKVKGKGIKINDKVHITPRQTKWY